jgi:hypothetical protein
VQFLDSPMWAHHMQRAEKPSPRPIACWLHHPQLDAPKSSSAGSTGGRPRGIRGSLIVGQEKHGRG